MNQAHHNFMKRVYSTINLTTLSIDDLKSEVFTSSFLQQCLWLDAKANKLSCECDGVRSRYFDSIWSSIFSHSDWHNFSYPLHLQNITQERSGSSVKLNSWGIGLSMILSSWEWNSRICQC